MFLVKNGNPLSLIMGVTYNYLYIVEKHQYNFSCSLHLYIKQNRTFLITNLSNISTNS